MRDTHGTVERAALRIREARESDLPQLVALLSQLHDEAPEDYAVQRGGYEAAFAQIVADGRQWLFVGEALVRHLVDQARTAGCYKAALMSNVARSDAHRFYERIGFRFVHRGYRIDL